MSGDRFPGALSPRQRAVKRAFDLSVAGLALLVSWPIMLVAVVVASLETRAGGVFRQTRIGLDGREFEVLKIRTMRPVDGSTVTTAGDARITRSGALMRRFKIDELPQLVNVLRGEMSIVGPRPDVPGFADRLTSRDRVVLAVRPGITSPAALAYQHEEELLARADDPEHHNREVIWPDKVRINRDYVEHWSLAADVACLRDTIRSVFATEPADQPDQAGGAA
jgi:lipopolysaccharide/colanic/teichoic acid biosynthesis glycosyltransferase